MVKITLDDEFNAFVDLVETAYPSLKVLDYAPKEPQQYDVVFSLLDSSTEELNRSVVEKLRSYQLLFYFDKKSTAVDYHSKIDSLFEEISSIKCQHRHIKVDDVVISRIYQTDSGKFAFHVIIEAHYHNTRTFEEVEKIQEITVTKID